MTNKQFWMKADQIAASRRTQEEKADEMAALLKTAYDEDLRMIILFIEKDNRQHHAYLNLDEKHPNTIGNRCLQCYTSRQRPNEDFISKMRGWQWGYTSTRDVINNLFNKAIIGSLIFNGYSPEWIVALPKEVLEKHIPGPHPKPEGFVDVPANGYPEIDRKYFH